MDIDGERSAKYTQHESRSDDKHVQQYYFLKSE